VKPVARAQIVDKPGSVCYLLSKQRGGLLTKYDVPSTAVAQKKFFPAALSLQRQRSASFNLPAIICLRYSHPAVHSFHPVIIPLPDCIMQAHHSGPVIM
jgi:hypothetical protein